MPKNLKITYDVDSLTEVERHAMEAEFDSIATKYRFAFYASGLNLRTNIRDISYEKEEQP